MRVFLPYSCILKATDYGCVVRMCIHMHVCTMHLWPEALAPPQLRLRLAFIARDRITPSPAGYLQRSHTGHAWPAKRHSHASRPFRSMRRHLAPCRKAFWKLRVRNQRVTSTNKRQGTWLPNAHRGRQHRCNNYQCSSRKHPR